MEHGITVVCSPGNNGPSPKSVTNSAPWMLTVAASTIDNDFRSDIILGDNNIIKGEGIHFTDLDKNPVYPLVSAKSNSDDDARKCDGLDGDKIKGKIVMCELHEDDYVSKEATSDRIKTLGLG